MSFAWRNPVDVRFGRGLAERLLEGLEPPVLVVRGVETLQRAGLQERFAAYADLTLAEPVSGLPEADGVAALASQVVDVGARTVLGIGGGSALDAARAAAVAAGHDPDPARALEWLRDGEPLRRGVALVLAPTTAGTGSEVTRWASLWEDGRKWSVASPFGYADRALVDPALTAGAGPRLTASSGLDAMTHACEALWGRRHNPLSDVHALRALALVGEHLLPAVRAAAGEGGASGPRGDAQRDAMSLASLHAGLAFSNTSTAAAHALSYELTGRHGVEHGLAVGLLLRGLLPFNAEAAPERVALAREALGVDSVGALAAFVDDVFAAAGLRPSLAALGVAADAHAAVVASALAGDRLANNPGEPDAADLTAALERVA